MDYQYFHDIIMLHFLGQAMDFSKEKMKLLTDCTYERPEVAVAYLVKFTKYLKEMEKRSLQKIPKEILNEVFPGNHEKDVYLSGIVT